ncbi:MAG: hypothetical protein COB02_07135 [Candidatus Cloacimonadota bacterium]|nr:MAG: hypothetical protein COB02_07135 [Candidatus Cloacimonadota bacterium]
MNKFFDSMSSLGILFVALIVVNLVSSQFYTKADITEEKLYSLSQGTKTILSKLEGELHIKYYMNKEAEAVPLYLKSYGQRIAELFQEYQDYSHGKITLEVLDPKADTEDEEWASKYGIKGLPLPNGDSFRMGAVFLSGSGEEVIPFFNPQKETFLEYEITEAISKTQKSNRKKIVVLSSYDMFPSQIPFQMPNQPAPKKGWMIIKELQKLYDVEEIKSDTKEIPTADLLMVVHPKGLSDDTTFAIDQYVMNGGRLLVMVDPSSQSEPNGQMGRPQAPKSSDLRKLFLKWGVQYNASLVSGDIDNSTRIRSAQGVIDFPIWMSLKEANTNKDNIAVSNLETLMMIEAGSFSLNDKVKDVKYTSLIDTGVNAGQIQSFQINRNDPMSISRNLKAVNKKLSIAGIFSGKFQSAFSEKPKDSTYNKEFKSSSDENSIFVIADTDFLADQYSVQVMNFFGQSILQKLNDNFNFVSNTVEFMCGDKDLISIRSRGKFSRPFDKVVNMQKSAQARYKIQEEEQTKRLQEVQAKINKKQSIKKEGNKIVLSRDAIEEIEKFRDEERQIKKKRREIRKNLREDVEKLGQKLTFSNVFLIPFLVGIYGAMRVLNYSKQGGR